MPTSTHKPGESPKCTRPCCRPRKPEKVDIKPFHHKTVAIHRPSQPELARTPRTPKNIKNTRTTKFQFFFHKEEVIVEQVDGVAPAQAS
jgi:hypothetical protein